MRPHLPSPAMAVALLALLLALTGTGYAVTSLPRNSVGTKQLRNGAVTTQKIASSAVAGVSRIVYAKATLDVPGGAAGAVTIVAPPGTYAIGGGVETPHTFDAYLLDSHPTSGGWQVSVGNTASASESVTVYAICVKGKAPKSTDATVARHRHIGEFIR